MTLSNSGITDKGLEHLRTLSKLTYLILHETQVTDSGLEHLRTLSNLRGLNVFRTQVTEQGKNRLLKALPNCDVNYSEW